MSADKVRCKQEKRTQVGAVAHQAEDSDQDGKHARRSLSKDIISCCSPSTAETKTPPLAPSILCKAPGCSCMRDVAVAVSPVGKVPPAKGALSATATKPPCGRSSSTGELHSASCPSKVAATAGKRKRSASTSGSRGTDKSKTPMPATTALPVKRSHVRTRRVASSTDLATDAATNAGAAEDSSPLSSAPSPRSSSPPSSKKARVTSTTTTKARTKSSGSVQPNPVTNVGNEANEASVSKRRTPRSKKTTTTATVAATVEKATPATSTADSTSVVALPATAPAAAVTGTSPPSVLHPRALTFSPPMLPPVYNEQMRFLTLPNGKRLLPATYSSTVPLACSPPSSSMCYPTSCLRSSLSPTERPRTLAVPSSPLIQLPRPQANLPPPPGPKRTTIEPVPFFEMGMGASLLSYRV